MKLNKPRNEDIRQEAVGKRKQTPVEKTVSETKRKVRNTLDKK